MQKGRGKMYVDRICKRMATYTAEEITVRGEAAQAIEDAAEQLNVDIDPGNMDWPTERAPSSLTIDSNEGGGGEASDDEGDGDFESWPATRTSVVSAVL